MPRNNSGRRQPGNSAVPSTDGRPSGCRWILGQGLRGGGPGRPPGWRTLKESLKGLGSVSLKINNQHTLGGEGFWVGDYETHTGGGPGRLPTTS
jgi:hypothetical protein